MMGPNNTQPPSDNPNLAKLEEDLQKLTKEAAPAGPQPSAQTVPTLTPPTPEPNMPVVLPAETPVAPANPTLTPPVSTPTPPPTEVKKSSPLLVVALVLIVIALVAAIAYVFGMKYFSPSVVTPIPTSALEVIPTEVPIATPVGTIMPSASPSASPTASASAKPTVKPSAIPTILP